jgi:hypothetical protein
MKDWLNFTQIYRYTQDERGVAGRAFTEILRFGSVWHSIQLGDNDWQRLVSLIADIVEAACARALSRVVYYMHSFGNAYCAKVKA